MPRSSPDPKAFRPAPWVLLAIAGILLATAVVYPFWNCDLAVWHCPASGCDSVPERACQSAQALALPLLVSAAVLLAVGWVLLRSVPARKGPRSSS